MTQQPPEKKVSLYHLYYCQWKIGDIYSYQLDGEAAKKTWYRWMSFVVLQSSRKVHGGRDM